MAFGVGCSVLALWADFRLETIRPSSLRAAMLHVAVAMLIAKFLIPAGVQLVRATSEGTTTALGGIFLVGLPGCVYCLLATFWVMRRAGEMLNDARQGPGSGAGI